MRFLSICLIKANLAIQNAQQKNGICYQTSSQMMESVNLILTYYQALLDCLFNKLCHLILIIFHFAYD